MGFLKDVLQPLEPALLDCYLNSFIISLPIQSFYKLHWDIFLKTPFFHLT